MKRSQKRAILISLDITMILLSIFITAYFLEGYNNSVTESYIWISFFAVVVMFLCLGTYFKTYSTINRYSDYRALFILIGNVFVSYLTLYVLSEIFIGNVNRRFILLSFFFSAMAVVMPRIAWQVWSQYRDSKKGKLSVEQRKRTLVVGAGAGASQFIQIVQKEQSDIEIVALLDGEQSKRGTFLRGYKVIGDFTTIPQMVVEYDIQQVVIAIPSLSGEARETILDLCKEANVPVFNMPNVEDVILGKFNSHQLKEIDVVDLLGRKEVRLQNEALGRFFSGRTILVTGAGGSIGSELSRQVSLFKPKRLLLMGHGENSIYLIHKELTSKYGQEIDIIPLIADIQDRDLMFELMDHYRPDIVYHAAAHKHVPMMEYNPREAIKNNILGTKNVAEAAKAAKVKKFIMVSTDKAVNPPNVMGATKRIAEMIVTGLNEIGKTQFAAVRFGNVLGSRGSVVPLFKEQIANGGPVTVTDFRMTRYFMTIPEASRLVIQAGHLAHGGEIFVLDMGQPVKILDLAKKVIKLSGYDEEDVKIVETGIRPGEKLYEELLATKERVTDQIYEKIFVGKVTSLPLEETIAFVDSLRNLPQNQLKPALIEFAKQE